MVSLPDSLPSDVPASGGLNRLLSSRRFQAWAARMPLLNRIVRAEGAAMFDLIQGFVKSQVLMALVELDLLSRLAVPRAIHDLTAGTGLTEDRMRLLLQAGAGVGMLRRLRDGRYQVTRRGAAFLGVPGLPAMVRHHGVLYRDLTDPVAFLRGETVPELARFWPYVFGAAAAGDPVTAARYSRLMEDSQSLVAEETLQMVDFRGITHLMDVGGGTGAFLRAVNTAHPQLRLTLFDLPAVLEAAHLPPAIAAAPGSFRDDDLPRGADAISLVRVLYDHADATVAALLAKVHAALPPGGRLIISEPMSGGDRPDPVTDVYFAFYCAAMQTGRTRSAAEIEKLLAAAGFSEISARRGLRPFVTGTITALRR